MFYTRGKFSVTLHLIADEVFWKLAWPH